MTGPDLALLGGRPVLTEPLPPYQSIGPAERAAVLAVLDSGCLSGFFGSPGPGFLGGPQVRAFEAAWRRQYDVAHAVSVNSATSGLIALMGAIGISPGDEVIVPPYSMSATAMAPIFYGGIPVFADIEPETFGLDPQAVAKVITPRTKAILVVNLFGHPARLAELRRLADTHGLYLIEDNAQAPLGREGDRWAGTVGHAGVFSLNYHKHIHTGEGGMCVTDDAHLAERLQLIRNHGENLVDPLDIPDLTNLVGMNLRMTELSAAVGLAQLAHVERHTTARERACAHLSAAIADLDGLTPPHVRPGCRHNYYCWVVLFDEHSLGLSRDTFCRALAAEGFPVRAGYLPPLYDLPLFRQGVAIGKDGFPFNLTQRRYPPGLCPTVENIEHRQLILFAPCPYDLDDDRSAALAAAIRKVHAGIPQLRGLEPQDRPELANA